MADDDVVEKDQDRIPSDPTQPDEEKPDQEALKAELLKIKQGLITPPTLDPGSQPAVMNADGSISTVRTMGAEIDGKQTNLPTVSPDGKMLTPDEAIAQYKATGKHLGQYDTPENADQAAEALHKIEAMSMSQVPKTKEGPVKVQPTTEPIVVDPNTPPLTQPDYTVKPDVKIKMLSTESKPGKTFSPEVERAIDQVKHLYPNMTREQLAAFIQVESGGDPRSNINKYTQYKGLLQIGTRDRPGEPSEWTRHGQGQSPYDAVANLAGGARLMERNRQDFIRAMKREPTPAELYLVHQQGLGFFTKGTMTNIAGNLPPDARRPENMTHEGFKRWWTNRINNEIARRGTAPTMRVAEPNLPNGFLYPGGFKDIGGKELTKGGLADTPQAQAMIEQMMRGDKPLAQMSGVERAVAEEAARAANDPNRKTNVLKKVPTSRETQQVTGELPVDPSSVNQTTLPIPGDIDPGEKAVLDATNPSFMSTIQNYPLNTAPPLPPVPEPVKPEEAKPEPEKSFIDKLSSFVKSFSPVNWSVDQIGKASEQMADAEAQSIKDQGDLAQGVAGGLLSQPMQVVSGVLTPMIGGAGLLTGSDTLKLAAAQGAANTEATTQEAQKFVGIDPKNMTPGQKTGQWLGENIGPGIVGTLKNLALSTLGESVIGPAADYMAKNYPIPNLNPIQPAEAASVFGKPPLIVQTPGGPVVMNDASIQQLVYGGVLSLGFGASMPATAKAVKMFKEAKPAAWTGLKDIFDPRREVTGAPGTIAASIPSDILKGGIVDNYQAMLDIADRQAKYQAGTKVGIDPYAADAAKFKWRVQTGSGAQNLIHRAIVDGKLFTEDFRFDVPVSIGMLHDFAQKNPAFPEYIKMRMIVEHLTNNAIARNKLPTTTRAPLSKFPDTIEDNFGRTYNLTVAQGKVHRMEIDNPDFVTQHINYQNNLAATRDFVSNRNTNWIEHPLKLNSQATKMPSAPIFSHTDRPISFLEPVLAGQNPLSVAETAMRKAIAKQMKFDAEQHYINNVASTEAFTPRTAEWVKNNGAVARENGAILTRKMGGETTHWTADPLVVSILNADHMPVTGWGQGFQTMKNLFQTTTTGVAAPWFAPTGGIRAMEQGWATAPMGVRDAQGRTRVAAGPFSSLAAIPAQVVPRALNKLSPTAAWFENKIQNSNLGQLIDPKYHNLISRTMQKAYDDSFYKRMKDAGAYSGTTLQQDRVIHSNITAARLRNTNPQLAPIHEFMEKVSDHWMKFAWNPTKATFHAANEVLRAVQEAPNYAWAYKVGKTATDTDRPTIHGRAMSDAELAARMRNYTGDPSTRGFIYSTNPKTRKQELLNYQGPGEWRANLYKTLGVGVHGMRVTTPWAGVLIQSPAATLKAMRDNPVRASLAFTASAVLPETVAYLWNLHQTEEEKKRAKAEGRANYYDYNEYQMIGRGNNPLMNNVYFAPVGGGPPQTGLEFPHFQETIFQRYMTRAFWQQYYGLNMHNMSEDVAAAVHGFLGGAVVPPQPSWLTALYGMSGAVAPEGFLGGIQKRKVNPYITLGGGESPTELTARALMPSLADIFIQAQQAGLNAPTWGDVPKAVGKQVGERVMERTAVLGSVLGYKPPVALSTEISEELWKRKHVIDDLLYRWKVWDTNRGDVRQKPASQEGGAHVRPYLPDMPPDEKTLIPNPGEPQPAPKNPLYKMMMDEMQATFERDMPSKGGIGWKSLWKDYMKYGSLVARMKTVNHGNEAHWMQEHAKNDAEIQFLNDHGVDPFNFKQVRDFYAAQHNDVANTMMRTIRATEQRIDAKPEIRALLKDKHFTVNMLDPNEVGIRNPEDTEGQDQ
jgi:hypothetical protein